MDWAIWPIWKQIHIPYCLALSDLTLTLWLASRRQSSKMTSQRAVDGLQRRLDPDDPMMLTAMFNLARTYLHLGEDEKCRKLLVRVLRQQKRLFGMKHPDTLMTRNELGISLCASKRHLIAAQRLVENVLQARREILGDEHAYTLWSVNDLSKIYVERGRADEAVIILGNIIPVVVRMLGKDHIGMSLTRSNLGKAYFMVERLEEAAETVRSLLAQIPADHPDWIHNMYGYAHIRYKLGFIEEAEKSCIGMLDIITRTKNLSLDDSRTVAIAELLISIYRSQEHEDKIAAIKTKIPSVGLIRKQDRFDPYAIRKGSNPSPQVPKGVSFTGHTKSDLPPRHSHGQKSGEQGTPCLGPFPKPVARRTF